MGKEKNIKSLLYLYLFGGLCAFLILFITLQYMIFKREYDQNLLKEASGIERSFQNILNNYKIILEEISGNIKENNMFYDKKGISDYLEKAYAYGIENESRERVRTSGVNWVGVGDGKASLIGRLGELRYNLEFTPEYLKKLEKNSGTLEVSDVLPVNASSDFLLINFGIGVRDNNGKYRGFVNARVTLESLIDAISLQLGRDSQFILLNEKGDVVISSLPVGQSVKKDSGMLDYFKEFYKGNLSSPKYVFPIQLPVHMFSYVLCFGYDQNQFYMLFLKQYYLSFLLFCSFLCIVSYIFCFYHKKFIKKSLHFYKELNREKNIKINQLSEENHHLIDKENKLEKYIKSSEEGDKEEKKFYLEINNRISQSLSNMLNVANFLLNRIQEEHKIEEDPKELMEVFENTYVHSRFFTLKREEELVCVNDVLDEAIVVLSKQILKKDIHVKFLKEKVTAILTDKTALKQAIINILGRAIKNSPKKGEITLTLFTQEEVVCLECKDNGYLAEYPHKELSSHEEKSASLDCISLEREDMEKLIKSLGGTLSGIHKPYKGNTYLLKIPYQSRKENTVIKTVNDNIVFFEELKTRS